MCEHHIMRSMFKQITQTLVAIAILSLAGCGSPSKLDISKKTVNIKTKAELENVLGKPDDFNKLGPIETWKYKASDGEVVFLVVGDKVKLQAAGGDKPK